MGSFLSVSPGKHTHPVCVCKHVMDSSGHDFPPFILLVSPGCWMQRLDPSISTELPVGERDSCVNCVRFVVPVSFFVSDT